METTELKIEDLTTVIRGGFIVPKDDTHISKWQIEEQRLDHCTHLPGVLAEHIRPGDFCIDIGAYDGDLTICMSRLCGESGMVVACEASKLAFQCLLHNARLFQHPKQCFPIHTAISDVCGSTVIHEINSSGNLGASICRDIPDSERVVGTTYLMTTTADFIYAQAKRSPALIKMDIEGYEYKALLGSSKCLKECKPKLILEINSSALMLQGDCAQDVYTLLDLAGYTYTILQKECTVDSPMFDILALPKP